MPAVRQNIERWALRAGGRLEALQTYDPSEIGPEFQMEHREGLTDVRYAPESDHLLRSSEMTLCANTDQSAVQLDRPLRPRGFATGSGIRSGEDARRRSSIITRIRRARRLDQ